LFNHLFRYSKCFARRVVLVKLCDAMPIKWYNNNGVELCGQMPNKQLKMLYGWAALHQDELQEEWYLAQTHKELFPIEPLK